MIIRGFYKIIRGRVAKGHLCHLNSVNNKTTQAQIEEQLVQVRAAYRNHVRHLFHLQSMNNKTSRYKLKKN